MVGMSSSEAFLVRPLAVDDRAGLRAMCEKRDYPDSIFLTPAERKAKVIAVLEKNFDSLHAHPNLRCLVVEEAGRLVGYSLSLAGDLEGTTGDRQTDLLDFYTPTPRQFEPLIARVKEQARADGDAYVVCTVYHSQKREAMWLAKEGFRVESLRNCREIAPDSVSPEHPRYRLRRARQSEVMFIMRLVMTHSPLYAPAGRPVDPHAIAMRFLSVYSELNVRDKKKVPLIMAERETDIPVAYMILQPKRVEIPHGKLTLYTYDVAVGEEAKGQGLGRYLNFGGMNLMARMGGGIFYGDTPADNTIAQSASEALGFRPDSKRWGFAL
jgi:hypothetical protein